MWRHFSAKSMFSAEEFFIWHFNISLTRQNHKYSIERLVNNTKFSSNGWSNLGNMIRCKSSWLLTMNFSLSINDRWNTIPSNQRTHSRYSQIVYKLTLGVFSLLPGDIQWKKTAKTETLIILLVTPRGWFMLNTHTPTSGSLEYCIAVRWTNSHFFAPAIAQISY